MKLVKVVLILAVLCIAVQVAQAKDPAAAGAWNNGKSWLTASAVHIDYVELDEYLDVVEGGAFGKMTYNKNTQTFVFNGHRLDPGVHYALIAQGGMAHYTFIILGDGVADSEGNIHLAGSVDHDSLEQEGGAVTYLVLYDDMEWVHETDGDFAGWVLHRNHPTEYLFGKRSL